LDFRDRNEQEAVENYTSKYIYIYVYTNVRDKLYSRISVTRGECRQNACYSLTSLPLLSDTIFI
jgi:hypothetical protein